ncbi:MAG TPA: FeoA family protein [Actinomycetota bacterium]|nr:FeoA family protein [Actinomycetota bacterium]
MTLACHSACPLGAHCDLICCPNCGFQVVDASKTRFGGWLSRTFRSREADLPPNQVSVEPAERPSRETVPLSHVLPGREVRIVALRQMSGPRISRLGAFGLVPGSRVEVVQRRPTPVVRVGETEIALSVEILEGIEVAPPTLDRAVGEGA